MNKVKYSYRRNFRHNALYAFRGTIPENVSFIDAGGGNNSSHNMKNFFHGYTYAGLGVGDYNENRLPLANHHIMVAPDKFSDPIISFKASFDAAISSHNLEDCDELDKTLHNMPDAGRPAQTLVSDASQRSFSES